MGDAPAVLMTADAVGGVWDHALTLAGEIGRRRGRVTLAVLGDAPSADQRAAAADVPGLALEHIPGRLEWMPGAADDVAAAGRALLALERAVRPDIVHVNGYAHAALPFDAPVLCAAHSCVWSWFRAVHGTDPPAAFDAYTAGVERGLAAASAVVAPSAAMAASLAWHYGVADVAVIPNGVAPWAVALGGKEPLILSAGRLWDEAKNVALLSAAAPSLGAPVVLAGGTVHPYGSRIPLPDVRLLGRLPKDELRGWYARAAIFCLPARYEPFGLAALEAGLSGCALVLGDISSLREVWGDAALYVRPDDRAGLTRTINRLLSDQGWRCDLAERARIRAGRYTAVGMADAYLALYGRLLGGGPLSVAAE